MSIKRKNRKYSLSEKLEVVGLCKTGYGCTIISRDLNISEAMVQRWINIYRVLGLSGLNKQRSKHAPVALKSDQFSF